MDGGSVGLKFAVLSGQIGLAPTVLFAAAGNDRNGANASAAVRAYKRLSSMTRISFLPLALKQGNCVDSLLSDFNRREGRE
jgi:hypothetical protein